MANPRLDDLRKRLGREPGSRLFAQLAEELRKDGALLEAIQVCREGLQRHPTYWSARLTLGRCLADSGDRRGAAQELEQVLSASPDNLLAGRLLAECQEGLEEFVGAAETYRQLLGVAPGDKQLRERLVQAELRASVSAASPKVASPDVQDRFAPIPLVEADDEFELERSVEAASFGGGGPKLPPEPVAQALPVVRDEDRRLREEMVFEFDAAEEPSGSVPAEPVFRALAEPLASGRAAGPASAPLPVTLPGVMLSDVASPALASATLAELYQQQGASDRAIETYREVLRREPGNAAARQRLDDLLAPAPERAVGPPSRRQVLERTIARLEALAAVLQKG